MPDRDAPFDHSAADEIKTRQVIWEHALVMEKTKVVREVTTHDKLWISILELNFGLKAAGTTPWGGKRFELPLPAE